MLILISAHLDGGMLLLQYPVYFAFENDEIDAVLDDVKKNDATGQPATATTGGLVDNSVIENAGYFVSYVYPLECELYGKVWYLSIEISDTLAILRNCISQLSIVDFFICLSI